MKESEKLRAIGASQELIEMMEQREHVEEEAGDAFAIIREGMLSATVCSSLEKGEVERMMAKIPCGTTNGWALADRAFNDGSPNGRPCERKPETHSHYLFDA